MRPSETGCRRDLVAAAVLLLSALLALPAAAAELRLRKLRIETDPPGAEVLLIGGKAGYTPLTIGERALYPNDYSDDRAHLYGTVTLRRAGCETVVHRVTLDDLGRARNGTLYCGAPSPVRAAPADKPATPVSTAPPPAVPAAASGPAATEAASQRRLRQLQVLQELLDEGLIDSAEEQRIRRRLLEAP
jgi:hypothetical protein